MIHYPLVLTFILFFVIISIVITWYTQKYTSTSSDFFAGGRKIPWIKTGIAMVGSYLSAASFLGVAGDIAIFGVDRIWLAIGFFGGYMAVLLLIAGPLRNIGTYTVADAIHKRFPDNRIKLIVMVATLVISTFYLVPQLLGAGLLFELVMGWNFVPVTLGIGILISTYIIFGGMKATIYNQMIQALVLFFLMIFITVFAFLMMSDGSLAKLIAVLKDVVPPSIAAADKAAVAAAAAAPDSASAVAAVRQVLPAAPTALTIGVQTPNTLSQISTVVALIFGTAGLPHILIMFYTVPSAKAAKKSVALCIVALGIFYLCTILLGFLIMPNNYPQIIEWIAAGKPGLAKNMAVLDFSGKIGGQVLMALAAAGAVAAVLSTAAGLMITAASTISHDLYKVYINKKATEKQEIKIARITTLVMTALAVVLAVLLKNENVAWLVTLAFGIAASSVFPVLLSTIWWKRFTREAAIAGMIVGLLISVFFVVMLFAGVKTVFGLPTAGGPGLFGVTGAFLTILIVTFLTKDRGYKVEEYFDEAHKHDYN